MSNYHGENTMNFCYVYIPTIEFYDYLYQKVLQGTHIRDNTIILLLRSFIFLGGGNKAFKRNTIFNLTSL